MGSIDHNKKIWGNQYNWKNNGDEWSEAWGGTPYLWYGSIMPRILKFVPAKSILEIAPGFGRCTQYLKDLCKDLTIVDLNQNCINNCKQRFRDSNNRNYFVNDGKSLSMIPDNSIDFIFSWDSMVHVTPQVIQAYLKEAARILKPGGIGFIHHSNKGEFKDGAQHGRDNTMTADFFRKFCDDLGLNCFCQELINWASENTIDCISVFSNKLDHEPKMYSNPNFMSEARILRLISEIYNGK